MLKTNANTTSAACRLTQITPLVKPPKKITRKWLVELADRIYDPKDRSFLRLCHGTLQNGPDPTDGVRTMHCGLGELYFAMTGRQPEQDGVSEEDVCDRAVDLSGFADKRKAALAKAAAAIKELDLDESLTTDLLDRIQESADDSVSEDSDEYRFREILSEIPSANDGCEDGRSAYEVYRKRACRVAKELRKAAEFLD